MRYFILVLALLLIFPAVLAQENNTATPVCPSEEIMKTLMKSQVCADGSTVSCMPKCDSSTGKIIDCYPECPISAQQSSAIAQTVCAEVITHAVSPEGTCQIFSNSCIPSGWKVVDRCPAPQNYVSEQVKCVFRNSRLMQECYSSDGKFRCSGDESCIADVSGASGYGITWKSSCGGYAYTKIDGSSESAEFDCAQATVVAPQIPVGCKEIKDATTGIVNVVCESVPAASCPTFTDYDINKCKMHNGIPNFFADSRGCKIFECRFQQANATSSFIQQPVACPSEQQRQEMSDKCLNYGGKPVMRKDFSGCIFVDCIKEAIQERKCPPIDEISARKQNCIDVGGKIVPEYDMNGCEIPRCIPAARMCPSGDENDKAARECEARNWTVIPVYDNIGCKIIKCAQPGSERPREACTPPPKEAFENCNRQGGEFIIKNDEFGCPIYAKCVKKGDETNVAYEGVGEVPQSSVLLSLAFKLEQLKMDFDKLSKQTGDIANYYASAGNSEEEQRFRKVSSMFVGANAKIDEIKSKMRERVNSLTKEDIADFKHDLKYIKEVVIQDILYVMLSTGAVSEIKEASKTVEVKEGITDCRQDNECFSKMLRTCEKTKFYPDSPKGTEVSITGLEGKNCIIKASVTDPAGKAYDMVCKYPNYVMGMPSNFLEFCSGSMVEMLKSTVATKAPAMATAPQRFPANKVKLYITPTCSYCDDARRLLKDSMVSFEEINVETEEMRKALMEKYGNVGFPLFDIDGKVIVGLDKTAVKEALYVR